MQSDEHDFQLVNVMLRRNEFAALVTATQARVAALRKIADDFEAHYGYSQAVSLLRDEATFSESAAARLSSQMNQKSYG